MSTIGGVLSTGPLFSLITMLILGAIISVVYSFVFQIVGPARYGPTDVPPVKVKNMKNFDGLESSVHLLPGYLTMPYQEPLGN